jgi:hypothetical protein
MGRANPPLTSKNSSPPDSGGDFFMLKMGLKGEIMEIKGNLWCEMVEKGGKWSKVAHT